MANGKRRPLIFISYSKFDDEAKAFVARQLGVLKHVGDIKIWDDSEIGVGDNWFDEIDTNLKRCSVAILLISADFLGSEFCMKDEVPVLLERRQNEGMMIAPILLQHCAWEIVPWLESIQMQPRRDVPLLTLDVAEQAKEMKAVVLAIHSHLKKRMELVQEAVEEAEAKGQQVAVSGDGNNVIQVGGNNNTIVIERKPEPKPDAQHPPLPKGAVDLTRLPTSGREVVGRDKELQFLNEAFDGTDLNVVSLVAWGGVGKSTLVNKWCEYLAADNYRGARRTFAWSFYSQGTNQRVTSADAFIDAAFTFFGEGEAAEGSPWRRGERLAELVGREKSLLILDGMEPLQDANQGIKDPALARLVECLAAENAGLCVITTREPVKELLGFPETTVEKNLEYLSKEAGRALLRIKGLRAGDDVLEEVSAAFGNHALALSLLANYLKLTQQDVQAALGIPDLPDVSIDAGKHPRRVMDAFAETFGEGPELDLLDVMGLFDRPADAGCIAALREPAVPGLTERLSTLDQIGWRDLLEKLRDLGLLAEASRHDPDELDAHPLVREHFGARLRARRNDAWQAGHERLYEHLKGQAEHRPDSLAAMAPLFQAVHHGCQAGRRQEALGEVYYERIVRKADGYLVRKLGAFGADLGLVASFFDPPFEKPSADLTDEARAWLLSQAAFRLRALGRLGEALAPMRAGLEMAVEQRDWDEAARRASNLSELQLALGEVAAAEASGEASVDHADRSGNDWQMFIVSQTTLADARHQAGALEAAGALFAEAEAMQAERQTDYPRLYSVQGNRYCDLLLTLGQAEAVRERALQALEWAKQADASLLDFALNHLSLGRAVLALGDRGEARTRLDQAVDGLREAGQMDDLPRGLLARAALFREVEQFAPSRRDLDEVMRLAIRCGLGLHKCDAHLEYARLALAEGRRDVARRHLDKAAELVEKTGYHRRDGEVVELKAALGA
ncbi:MAG: toll/interleukin-1 receptor domain-containing protein [Alphaproteobacteria bacterium]|nr:toll/interleukin-1 receptor domain-containing protein [Alphaproteobacteria bacterium]